MDRAFFNAPIAAYEGDFDHDFFRVATGGNPAEPHERVRSDKLPGWLRLALPVSLSLALWAPIIGAARFFG